ncbi:MAG: hypothetical protein QUS09_10890, partial [Methanotrichaceae archaeon]|nr:hypothetical protein [Methanotrichaceae archaeon]
MQRTRARLHPQHNPEERPAILAGTAGGYKPPLMAWGVPESHGSRLIFECFAQAQTALGALWDINMSSRSGVTWHPLHGFISVSYTHLRA